ncbi:hypothetical protein T07_11058 [Trichinella nelsoni]|uniref:Uncharacterized protein n=1 Tax=Trichinella nelsoni TaxID=6336 RepID=A0A0V0S2A0_9BILA|nr:hypothetical protein T07_11058 [Trichinella nelsoni]
MKVSNCTVIQKCRSDAQETLRICIAAGVSHQVTDWPNYVGMWAFYYPNQRLRQTLQTFI